MENQQWQDAHVGVESKNVTFRATEVERKRLEDLRKVFGLTSKSQVIRLALDMLETVTVGSAMVATTGNPRHGMNHMFDGWERMTASIAKNTKDPDIAASFSAFLEDSDGASDASSGSPAEAPNPVTNS